jgi:hypothetical protein
MKNLYFIIIAVVLIAAISLTGSSCKKEQKTVVPPPTPEQKAKIEENKKVAEVTKNLVVAAVNGVDITMQDLVREMNLIAERNAKGEGKAKPAEVEKVKKEALDNIIFKELAVQESIKQGIVVSPERVDGVIELMKKQMGSAEKYKQYLDELALTEPELRKRIERSQRIELITGKEIYQKVKINDRDVREEYEKNKGEYKDNTGRQLNYEEAANFIRRKMISQKGAALKKKWANTLRTNASIAIFKEALK